MFKKIVCNIWVDKKIQLYKKAIQKNHFGRSRISFLPFLWRHEVMRAINYNNYNNYKIILVICSVTWLQ